MVGDLLKWWQSEFEAAEQDYILTRYQPMVIGDGTSGSNTPLRYIIAPDGTLGSISSLAALATKKTELGWKNTDLRWRHSKRYCCPG